jgi:hypothetical protein
MGRLIASTSDIYGSTAGPTFFQQNSGPESAARGTSTSATVGGTNSGGYTTGSSGSDGAVGAISPVSVATGIQGTIIANPVFQWCVILVVTFAVYHWAKRAIPGMEGELGTPRVSVSAFLSIGVQAWLFIILVNTLLKKYNVPGLSGLAALA